MSNKLVFHGESYTVDTVPNDEVQVGDYLMNPGDYQSKLPHLVMIEKIEKTEHFVTWAWKDLMAFPTDRQEMRIRWITRRRLTSHKQVTYRKFIEPGISTVDRWWGE